MGWIFISHMQPLCHSNTGKQQLCANKWLLGCWMSSFIIMSNCGHNPVWETSSNLNHINIRAATVYLHSKLQTQKRPGQNRAEKARPRHTRMQDLIGVLIYLPSENYINFVNRRTTWGLYHCWYWRTKFRTGEEVRAERRHSECELLFSVVQSGLDYWLCHNIPVIAREGEEEDRIGKLAERARGFGSSCKTLNISHSRSRFFFSSLRVTVFRKRERWLPVLCRQKAGLAGKGRAARLRD